MEKGRGNNGKDQQQRGKGKMPENQMGHPQQPPPHHRCPRCDSDNTKFCYYNNYSFTQPRYFCKTCRRYWTQGGSLRNVPVGGGSRRAKQDKASSFSNGEGSSRSVPALPPLPHPLSRNLSGMVGLLSSSFGVLPGNHAMRGSSSAITPVSSLYSSNGFIPSLAAMQNLNRSPAQGFNRQIRIGGSQTGGSGFGNLSVLQEFNRSSTMRPQHPQMPPVQQSCNLQNTSSRGKEPMYPCDEIQRPNDRGKEPMYPSGQSFCPAARPLGSWNQSFSNNNINPMDASSSILWNGSSCNTGDTSNGGIPGSSLDPNEWPDDLPDFGPPEI